eukprot:CAMPEP_0172617184 /NCGR_PEP_ID=MMETSP1068-20121228/70094_1 /TAXON_ID=35684 /ORGANISM="Pseudopedinella elastica, Strain CCMP716" /LENGTH=41 /DNA_ID= /DNA_START= /DNA_END= /DNA_ORIENTATION=
MAGETAWFECAMYREEDQNGGERNFANAVTLLGSADWYSPG